MKPGTGVQQEPKHEFLLQCDEASQGEQKFCWRARTGTGDG